MTSKTLYRNKQWKVVSEGKNVFLIETRKDGSEGYWATAQELATSEGDHTVIEHVMEKYWVDPGLFEAGLRMAIQVSGLRPNYNLDVALTRGMKMRYRIYDKSH